VGMFETYDWPGSGWQRGRLLKKQEVKSLGDV
jgi:hypothetical protein